MPYALCNIEAIIFVMQLCSLYELRPPISRTKMAEVTELAIKSVKFYKHVVQSVEKFIQKVKHIVSSDIIIFTHIHSWSVEHVGVIQRKMKING